MSARKESIPVRLKSFQKPHCNYILNRILPRSSAYLDTSPTGCGKTYCAGYIAQKLGLPILVVCPAIAMGVWADFTKAHNIPVVDIISYDTLRSKVNYQPKHGFLTREDTYDDKKYWDKKKKAHVTRTVRKTVFSPTSTFETIVQRGVFLVFDEIQKLKNATIQTDACLALANVIYGNPRSPSKIGLLSALPFDKQMHIVGMLRLLGIMTKPKLLTSRKVTGRVFWLGLQEVVDVCMLLNEEITKDIVDAHGATSTRSEAIEFCFKLYDIIIKHEFGSQILPPAPTYKSNYYNSYFDMSKDQRKLLTAELTKLENNFHTYVDEVGEKINIAELMKRIKPTLKNIELLKSNIFIRVSSELLEKDPYCKVIICLNYIAPIEAVIKALACYSPVALYGKISSPIKRNAIIKSFQKDDDCRLLVMNTRVGGVSISLHDLVGGRKRYILINPEFNIIDTLQAAGRIDRLDCQSDTEAHIVYANISKIESDIVNNILKKCKVLATAIVNKKNIILPDTYPIFIEFPRD